VNGIKQILVYFDNIMCCVGNTETTKNNVEILLQEVKENCLEIR